MSTVGSIEEMRKHGHDFHDQLVKIRAQDTSVAWYPHQSMTNVDHIAGLVPNDIVEKLIDPNVSMRVLDIGAADGDLGFFFESRGCDVDFLDNPATNANDCKGLGALSAAFGSRSRLILQDIDRSDFSLKEQYDFAIALGLLYHLRNPMGFLITLAEHAERMVLSTRVANRLPNGTSIENVSVAYLLFCRESNNDPTNYWTLSPLGLETMLKRCGWDIKMKKLTGAKISNPVDNNADQRMFVYCERVANWQDLSKHHDF
jgi:2-polyprenyl-3-methyl-5-hydroxy-6-metoxy-1,4-benzoquinol methylase